jgi:predicted nuclease of predicted toxin-antitoxin system
LQRQISTTRLSNLGSVKGLVLDQGLRRSAASLLRACGVETVHVDELGMATAPDSVILEHARNQALVVITLDSDFHSLLAVSGASAPTVVRLRVERLKATDPCELIASVVLKTREELTAGAVVSATTKFIRIKRLPIKR